MGSTSHLRRDNVDSVMASQSPLCEVSTEQVPYTDLEAQDTDMFFPLSHLYFNLDLIEDNA